MATDDEFVERLKELHGQGEPGRKPMWEMLKGDGLERLIKLADRGVGVKPKKPTTPKAAKPTARGQTKATQLVRIPFGCPSGAEKQCAMQHWASVGRPDLVSQADKQVEKFRVHFASRGVKMEDWSLAWRAWYENAVEFERPPRGANLRSVLNSDDFEQTTAAGWIGRLETFYFGGADVPAGFWLPKYGGKPDTPEFRGPPLLLERVKSRLAKRTG